MPVFNFIPDPGVNKLPKNNVVKIQFGDGYSQRQPVGINSNSAEYTLNFNNRSQSEADAIDTFLTSMGGCQSFDFTPPNSNQTIKVVCESGGWSVTIVKGSFYNIQVKLTQVFEP